MEIRKYPFSEGELYLYADICRQMDPAGDYAPSDKELASIESILNQGQPSAEEWLYVLMWIDESGTETDENREQRRKMKELINRHLEITETPPEIQEIVDELMIENGDKPEETEAVKSNSDAGSDA